MVYQANGGDGDWRQHEVEPHASKYGGCDSIKWGPLHLKNYFINPKPWYSKVYPKQIFAHRMVSKAWDDVTLC